MRSEGSGFMQHEHVNTKFACASAGRPCRKCRQQLLESLTIEMQPSAHPYAPEGIPVEPSTFRKMLLELPDRSLVQKLRVKLTRHPDDWVGNQPYRGGIVLAIARTTGEITFYKPEQHRDNRLVFFHEWSHLLKYVDHLASRLFNTAAILEEDGYFFRDYGRTNHEENWAVHMGEVILAPMSSRFLEFCEEAPLRALILGLALARALRAVPASRASPYHRDWLARCRYIRNYCKRPALGILRRIARGACCGRGRSCSRQAREILADLPALGL